MILVLGGRGFIGSRLCQEFARRSIKYRCVSRSDCDYVDRDQLIELIRQTKATFLINAAGYTGKPNVDACELHKADCLLGNAALPGIIREACEMCGLPWGHVSSGCIYSGTRPDGTGFVESDPPNFSFRQPPCSFYSGSKALGEECLHGAENVFVWRLRIPFDCYDSDRNYLSKVRKYDRLLDVTNSITHLGEFITVCLESWLQRIDFGIYNVTNPGTVTTRQVAALVGKYLAPEKQFQFFDDETQFMQQAATAPRSSCVLDSSKIQASGLVLSDVHEAIERALANWQPASVIA